MPSSPAHSQTKVNPFPDSFVSNYADGLIAYSRLMAECRMQEQETFADDTEDRLRENLQRLAELRKQEKIISQDEQFWDDETERLEALVRDTGALYPHEAAAIHQALEDQKAYDYRLSRERRVARAHWEALLAEHKMGMDRMKAAFDLLDKARAVRVTAF
ncbi:unnamed protein product [Peniophora sp. CBMAI 1063]|nr:unnamed protein product [Peniophora sp. CBMAI 1063]